MPQKILVVDDDEDIVYMLKSLCKKTALRSSRLRW